jgi:hypothetical protein
MMSSCTPGGTRTPGWIPLVYVITSAGQRIRFISTEVHNGIELISI